MITKQQLSPVGDTGAERSQRVGKSGAFKLASLSSLLLAGVVGLSVPASADAPTIELLTFNGLAGPNPQIFVGAFPTTISVAMAVTHSEVKNLNVLDLQLDGDSVLNSGAAIGNPFSGPANTNACSSLMVIGNGVSACNVADSSHASATLLLPIAEPGQYSVTLSIKHASAEGDDDESVEVLLLNVEFPAPPAVANAFLNSQSRELKKLLTGGVRGCIISRIAGNHALDSKYGPKGGPYDNDLINEDSAIYSAECGGPVLP